MAIKVNSSTLTPAVTTTDFLDLGVLYNPLDASTLFKNTQQKLGEVTR